MELTEDYLDWFFMHYFHKDPKYWQSLTMDQLTTIMTLEIQKEEDWWKNWSKMLGGKNG